MNEQESGAQKILLPFFNWHNITLV